MPYSVFCGRAVGDGPLWTHDDRLWALALAQYEASMCSCCGQPIAEAFDPDNDGRYDAEGHICYAGRAIARARGDNSDDAGLFLIPTLMEGRDDDD